MVTHRRSTKRRWVEPTAAGKPFRIFNTLLMTLLSLLFAAPFLLIAIASLTPEVEIAAKGFQFFPSRLTLYNYQYLFGASARFTTAMRTTATLTVVGTLWSLFFTSMGAYAMSRTYLPYRKGLMFFVTLTMLINGGLIPWYMVVINLGLKDSMAAMIIPGTISVWNLIVMRNSFMAIPPSLEESARIDGANDLTIFFRIILPVSKPIMDHAGSVQNMKFTPDLFNRARPKMAALLQAYFDNGGTQAMITVTGRRELEEALLHPEQYRSLLVRVGGFSARFIELEKDVQQEVLSRTCY